MSEMHHECGVAAIYHFSSKEISPLCPSDNPDKISRLLPRMLQDIQNRGQLAAGMSCFNPTKARLLQTYKDIGPVSEVFRLAHRGKSRSLMREYRGRAAIGHVRYATCGQDNREYAQPFEREHIVKHKWFTFCFNGQLANYQELKAALAGEHHHLSRDSDTEIIMHEIGRILSNSDPNRPLVEIYREATEKFDGAYVIAILNARGELLIGRDPQGIKPMCYAVDGPLFAAASESVALLNLPMKRESIKDLPPGHVLYVKPESVEVIDLGINETPKHCFFEWIYFANVASNLDGRSVYLSRTRLGEELARIEKEDKTLEIDSDTIVVPVPDTSKAAADSMAFHLGIPCHEGLIRNRYSGRTFIEGGRARKRKAAGKYTPLPEVLEGKRVILVEDSIVRSTTMRVLLERLREVGGAREIHVRVASPPIVSPCFYGIDMSTIGELFAPKFLKGGHMNREIENQMAKELGCDSLRYLPVSSIAKAIDLPADHLCQACIDGKYPTPFGRELYQLALESHAKQNEGRTYEAEAAAVS